MSKFEQVSILNQTFTVETEASSDHVKNVARYINDKIKKAQNQTRKASSLNIALLTCLNVADEFLRYKQETQQRHDQAEKKLEDLIEIVDLQL